MLCGLAYTIYHSYPIPYIIQIHLCYNRTILENMDLLLRCLPTLQTPRCSSPGGNPLGYFGLWRWDPLPPTRQHSLPL